MVRSVRGGTRDRGLLVEHGLLGAASRNLRPQPTKVVLLRLRRDADHGRDQDPEGDDQHEDEHDQFAPPADVVRREARHGETDGEPAPHAEAERGADDLPNGQGTDRVIPGQVFGGGGGLCTIQDAARGDLEYHE